MKLIIDLENLKDLSIAQYAFLWVRKYLPGEDPSKLVGITDDLIEELNFKGYLTENYELTNKFKDVEQLTILKALNDNETPLNKFVEQYRSIFPEGKNQSGYPYRGDKQGCLKKMSRFIKKYPKFSKDLILMATRDYVSSHFLKGYMYMQTAAYFIEKDGTSNLAGLCETLKFKSPGKYIDPSTKSLEEDLN